MSVSPTTVERMIVGSQGNDVPPVSSSSGALLELTSTNSALLISRMTQAQVFAIPNPQPGMMVYVTDDNLFAVYLQTGGWTPIPVGSGGGNVVGPTGSLVGQIATFADTNGTLLAGGLPFTSETISIYEIPPTTGLNPTAETVLQMQDMSLLLFHTNNVTDNDCAIGIYDNTGPGSELRLATLMKTGDSPSTGAIIVSNDLNPTSSSVNAILEINSSVGALLISRMTTVERDALVSPQKGMVIYDTSLEQFQGYDGITPWIPLGGGTGDVTGPGSSVTGDIAIFSDMTGKVIADSNLNVSVDVVTGLLQLSGASEIQLITNAANAGDCGLTINNGGTVCGLATFVQEVGGAQGSIVVSGIPGVTSSSPSGLLELQSTTGALIVSNMDTAQRLALTPFAGMIVCDTTIPGFQGYVNGAWTALGGGASDIIDTGANPPNTGVLYVGTATGGATSGTFAVGVGYGVLASNIGAYNTALGYKALASNTSGINNTSLGYSALAANVGDGTTTNGNDNTAIGFNALVLNQSGFGNVAVGSGSLSSCLSGGENVAVGFNALNANTAGGNTAVGYYALSLNTGQDNTGVGWRALGSNTGGMYNVAIGTDALGTASTDFYNTAVGFDALFSNNGGSSNTALGYNALVANSDGNYNVAIGSEALSMNSGSSDNIAIGYQAISTNSGPENVAIGSQALKVYSSGGAVAIGYGALAACTTNPNTAIGWSALNTLSGVVGNTAVGYGALQTSNGADNTAVGHMALNSGSSNPFNTAVGASSMSRNTGANNSALGAMALQYCNGNDNVSVGYNALVGLTVPVGTTMATVALGSGAGSTRSSYALCTFIGYAADADAEMLTNATAIGANAIVHTSNSLVLGGTGGNAVNVGIGTTAPKATLHVVGGQIVNLVSTGINYAALATDYIISCSVPGITITLPTPYAAIAGQVYIVQDASGGALGSPITINATASTVNAGSESIALNYGGFTIYTDGANWFAF